MPSAFAAYIAASAWVSRSSAVAPASIATATPIVPPTTIELAPSRIGRRNSRRIRAAETIASSTSPTLREEHRELVAALAPDDVLGPDRSDEPLGDSDEDRVPGRVAVRVVDVLEVVEIDEQQADRPATATPAGEGTLEMIAEEHPVGESRQRVVEGVVDQLRLQPLPVGDIDEKALRDLPAALGVVGHPVGLVPDPDLGAIASEHPVLGPERLACLPVRLVRGERGRTVIRVDPARPQLGIVHELLGPIAEDPSDLRAHVGESTTIGDVGIGHIDVDRGGDVLDEHLQPGARLLGLADGLLEHRRRVAQPPYEDDARADDDAKNDHRRGAQGNGRRRACRGAGQADEREPCENDGAAEQADDREAIGHAESTGGLHHAPRLCLPIRRRPLPNWASRRRTIPGARRPQMMQTHVARLRGGNGSPTVR